MRPGPGVDPKHCFRRAALRAASAQTARTAIVSKRVVPVFAAVPATVFRSTALPIARTFSVSRTLADAAEDIDNSTFEQESTSDATEPTQQRDEAPIQGPPNGIFIRNLVFDATPEHLTEAFSQYGNVVEARIARDPRGLSRGYGFVHFETPEAATKAIKEANNTFWHGRRISVATRTPRAKKAEAAFKARSLSESVPSPHLYIGNIPYESTDAELNKLFQSLENLKDVRIAVDRSTGWPRGFAHADFTDTESATKAIEQIKAMELMGRTLRVDFSSPPKGPAPRGPGGPRGYNQRSRNGAGPE
ncbi:hypothetical protein PspLS_07669 [Pyricularia sp. CBS 133598]|nr:hypothetical protein PspLS_07669 [Pyricularia sp. CBS 133598]